MRTYMHSTSYPVNIKRHTRPASSLSLSLPPLSRYHFFKYHQTKHTELHLSQMAALSIRISLFFGSSLFPPLSFLIAPMIPLYFGSNNPLILSNLQTGSLGCAPTPSQYFARAVSSRMSLYEVLSVESIFGMGS